MPEKTPRPITYNRCEQCGKNTRKDKIENGLCEDCRRWNMIIPGSYVLGNHQVYDEGFIRACVCIVCNKPCQKTVDDRNICVAILKAKQERQNKIYRIATQTPAPPKLIQTELTA